MWKPTHCPAVGGGQAHVLLHELYRLINEYLILCLLSYFELDLEWALMKTHQELFPSWRITKSQKCVARNILVQLTLVQVFYLFQINVLFEMRFLIPCHCLSNYAPLAENFPPNVKLIWLSCVLIASLVVSRRCRGRSTHLGRCQTRIRSNPGWAQGHVSISKPLFPGMGIPMSKLRQSQDRLIFNMGILTLVRRHLDSKTAPTFSYFPSALTWKYVTHHWTTIQMSA